MKINNGLAHLRGPQGRRGGGWLGSYRALSSHHQQEPFVAVAAVGSDGYLIVNLRIIIIILLY